MGIKGLYYEDFSVGQRFLTGARTITEADIVMFGSLIGDFNALHFDDVYAKTTQHGGRIAHGTLIFSYTSGLVSRMGLTEGTIVAYAGVDIQYKNVVRAEDTIHAELVIESKRESKKPDRGVVTYNMFVKNQNDVVVLEAKSTYVMKKREV